MKSHEETLRMPIENGFVAQIKMRRCRCSDVVCFFCHEQEIHAPNPQLEQVYASLQQRGSLKIWISSEAITNWTTDELTGEPGASPTYTDLAIETMATVQAIYGLAGRQTQGFLQSVFKLMKLDLTAPDHSTLSRWRRQLDLRCAPIISSISRQSRRCKSNPVFVHMG